MPAVRLMNAVSPLSSHVAEATRCRACTRAACPISLFSWWGKSSRLGNEATLYMHVLKKTDWRTCTRALAGAPT